MRRTTVAAFIATVCVAVPAGWRWLDADIERDGKRLRPLQDSFTVDDVTVKLDVDRSVVMTGDSVTAKLVAVGEAGKRVAVDVYAMNSKNYEGQRVEPPWVTIDKETVHLVAAPGGGSPVLTRIKLGEQSTHRARIDSFQIFAQAHGEALPKENDYVEEGQQTYYEREKAHLAAAIQIIGWSGNNIGLAIEPRGKLTANEPFTIAVRVKNTTNNKLVSPYVNLTTEATLTAKDDVEGEDLDDRRTYLKIERVDKEPDDTDDRQLAPGKEAVTLFTVTPHNLSADKIGKVTFLATAFEHNGMGPIEHGAYEARTFDFAKPKANAVATK